LTLIIDTKLAAEIGQSLLQANEKLQQDYNQLLQETNKTAERKSPLTISNDQSFVEHLEHKNASLEKECETLHQQVNILQQQLAKYQKHVSSDSNETKSCLEAITVELETTREANDRLLKEKLQWTEDQRKSKERQEQESTVLSKLVSDLEERLHQSETARISAESQLKPLQSDRSNMEQQLVMLQEQSQDYADMKAMYENQSVELFECKEAMADAEETIQSLSMRLEVYLSQEDSSLPTTCDRSLFNEVEDRRIELEHEHSNLSQKHEGLRRAHLATVHQQARMKNHISRLSQLSQSQSSSDILMRLESTVSQLRSLLNTTFGYHAASPSVPAHDNPNLEIEQSLLFLCLLTLFNTVVGLPTSIYSTFVIEQRHGFNKQTLSLYFLDLIKALIIGAILGLPCIAGTPEYLNISRSLF